MKNLLALAAGSAWLGDASAQVGPMMNGGMGDYGWMGGFGGYWVPVLLVIVVGLVAWILLQRRK
jgi:hypothetical protein